MRLERGATLGPTDRPGGGGEDSEGVLETVPEARVSIGHLKWGKLVAEKGGHVISDFEFTRVSENLPKDIQRDIVYPKLCGISSLDVAPGSSERGALVIRSLPDGSMAAARVRFRSEAGDGVRGRPYAQSESWYIDPQTWPKHAAHITSRLADLRAEPDVRSERPANWNEVEPREFTDPEHQILALEGLDADARFLAELISSRSEKEGVVVPSDKFADEKSFLEALGKAVETLHRTNPESVADMRITVGILEREGGWIQFMPQKRE